MNNQYTCQDYRLAAMAQRDGEVVAIPSDMVRVHLLQCDDCRLAVEEAGFADVLSGCRRDEPAIDVWTNVQQRLEAAEFKTRQPAAPRKSRVELKRTLGPAAAVLLAAVGLALILVFRPADKAQDSSSRAISQTPSQPSEATPKPYEIGHEPPKPVSREAYLARYSPYFEGDRQVIKDSRHVIQDGQSSPSGGFGQRNDREDDAREAGAAGNAPTVDGKSGQSTIADAELDAEARDAKWTPVRIETGERALGHLYFDSKGDVALAVGFPAAEEFSEGLAVVATGLDVASGHRLTDYGFIDRSGKLVIPGPFEAALPFHDGFAAVQSRGKYGFIDRAGRFVVPPQFVLAESFVDGVARVQPDHQTVTFIDRTGKQLFASHAADVGRFSEGLLYVNLNATGRGRHYVDSKFESVFLLRDPLPSPLAPAGFTPLQCEEFHEGLAAVEGVTGKGSGDWGYLSTSGELAIAGPFFEATPFSGGLAAVSVRNRPNDPRPQWGYVDRTGNIVVEPRFLFALPFQEGLAAVLATDESAPGESPTGRWGYIDAAGAMVIEPQFYRAGPFESGRASVKTNPWNSTLIDRAGQIIWRVDEPAE